MEVFKDIYNVGKKVIKTLKSQNENIFSKDNEQAVIDLITKAFHNTNTSKELKLLFKDYILNNGYPYLLKDGEAHLSIEDFIIDCTMIYLIDEIRKWVYKLKTGLNIGYKNGKNDSYGTRPSYKFESTFKLIKADLIYLLYNSNKRLIVDTVDNLEQIQLLESNQFIDITIDPRNDEQRKQDKEKYFSAVQRSLILFVVNKFNSIHHEQFLLTKQLPIFNEKTKQYRIYQTASSLMGIAYNRLLLDLTATKTSYERAICEIPNCNNEFEKFGKSPFCEIHEEKEIKWYINQKYYWSKKEKQQSTM